MFSAIDVHRPSVAAEIFRVEAAVNSNKMTSVQARALVQDNAAMIAKNYTSAFNGNRQLCNQNTDDLFRNRLAILSTFATTARSGVQAAYAEALTLQAKINFLQHREALNDQVLEITLAIAEVNAKNIEASKRVLVTNEEIVEFNRKYIGQNSTWLLNDGQVLKRMMTDATADTVAELTKANTVMLYQMERQASASSLTLLECFSKADMNRETIRMNEFEIYSRREQIIANRNSIHQNQQLVGKRLESLAPSAIGSALKAVAGIFAQPPEEKQRGRRDDSGESVWGSLGYCRAELFRVEAGVYENRSSAYEARSLVQENAALIVKNYGSSVNGNRLLCNQNTEDLFHNRLAMLSTLQSSAQNAVQAEYAEALTLREKLAFLQHHAQLNAQVLDITWAMADVNAKAIQVNQRVMETNEEIVEYNDSYIKQNAEWLGHGSSALSIAMEDATPDRVAMVCSSNEMQLQTLAARMEAEKGKVDACLKAARSNLASIQGAAELVQERAEKIRANREQLQENQQAVAMRLVRLRATPS